MANLTTTSDCPICLCPIPSEPWGVCTPCGHPYHRECWDQVVANHSGRRNKIKGAPCAVCKGCSQGFVPVFLTLDLRTVSEEGVSDSSQSAVGKSDQDLEDKENTYDELLHKWDLFWWELENLFGCIRCRDDEMGFHSGRSRGNSSCFPDASIEVIDVDDDYDAWEADIANIVRAADLTQQTNIRSGVTNPSNLSTTVIHDTKRDTSNEQSTSSDCSDEMNYTQHECGRQRSRVEQKQSKEKIQSMLERLQKLHNEIIQIQLPTRSINDSSETLQHLKSKIRNLQSITCDLRNENQSLEAKNTDLKSEIDQANQDAFNASLEYEREKTKLEKLRSKYEELRSTYRSQQARSQTDITKLQELNCKLQDKIKSLENEASLNDLEEMEDIRRKYSRMSQELYDARRKNVVMENQMASDKRDWERKIELERRSCDERVAKIQTKMESQRKENMAKSLFAKTEDCFSGGWHSSLLSENRITCKVAEPVENNSSCNRAIKTRVVNTITSATRANEKLPVARSKAIDALDKAPCRKSRVPLKRRNTNNQTNLQKDRGRINESQPDDFRKRNRVSQLFVNLGSDSSDDISLEFNGITPARKQPRP